MKKSISTLFSIAIILAACLSPSGGASAPINTARPQVTVASEATATFAPTPTDAPIPTPTSSKTPEPTPTLSPADKLDQQLQATGLFPEGVPGYTIGVDADGNTVAFNSEGEMIFNGARWNSELIFDIVENMLKITHDCEKAPYGPEALGTADQVSLNYLTSLRDKLEQKGIMRRVGQKAFDHFFESQNNCVGFFQGEQESKPEIFFWANSKGDIRFLRLFTPEISD